ncbi:hypothetical protein, partial [Thiolapillus sp.]|uniref:hypothetical protein n=1 Tax=Thiolapillus sp. TaxID=2017437 RepID=UPI003AF89215
MRTTGKQCGLAATEDYQPSLRSPWLAATDADSQENTSLAIIWLHLVQGNTLFSKTSVPVETLFGGKALRLKWAGFLA